MTLSPHLISYGLLKFVCISLVFIQANICSAVENIDPTVTSISVDRQTVDVSGGDQTVTFTVNASDGSGIDWGRSSISVAAGPMVRYTSCTKISTGVGECEFTFLSSDFDGRTKFIQYQIYDNAGNSVAIYSGSSSIDVPEFITVIGGVENIDPTVTSISVDRQTVDVSGGDQTVTFTVNASDGSGIDWGRSSISVAAGPMVRYTSCTKISTGVGECEFTFLSSDFDGRTKFIQYQIYDNAGNSVAISSGSSANHVPNFIYLLAPGEITSNLAISDYSISSSSDDKTTVTYLVNITNGSLVAADFLSLSMSSINLRLDQFSSGFPASACTQTSLNFSSNLSCSLGSIDGNSTQPLYFTFTMVDSDDGKFYVNIETDRPDISYSNNQIMISVNLNIDTDGDGILDVDDLFPMDSAYSFDTDLDGIPDAWELKYGFNPNEPSDALSDLNGNGVTLLDEYLAGIVPLISLDIDGNGHFEALSDGLLLLRGMFGFKGDNLINDALAADAFYTNSIDIESRINMLGGLADIDGDGHVDPLTDGLIIMRYLLGFEGDALINNVVSVDATRNNFLDIEAYIKSLISE